MHGRTRNTLIGYGLPTDLIEVIGQHGHNVGVLRAMASADLQRYYRSDWAELITSKIHREPIDPEVVQRVESAVASCCCFCADGNNGRPFQLHHIDHYADTQDNSEDNLLLVCPTHHVAIHEQRISKEEQKRKRREWHAIVEIVKEYQARGLEFPFTALSALDFGTPPRVADAVRGQPVTPSTALELCPTDLLERASVTLRRERLLVIRGPSGAGKSTTAVAVAGQPAREGYKVFRYRAPANDRRRAAREILEFFSVLVRNAVLILDDVNTYLNEDDLASVAKGIPETGLVIATWAEGEHLGGGRLEAHLPGCVQLTWEELRPHVTDVFGLNALTVSRVLREVSAKRRAFPVGLGHMDSSLHSHMETCCARAKTVSEFLFLLRGERAVDEMFRGLVADDRADLPMVYMSIEQIADFERPVTIREVVDALRQLKAIEGLPEPTVEWVAGIFQGMRSGVWVQRVRNAFTTLHREWARALICQALAQKPTREAAEEMLRRDFDVRRSNLDRLIRLWSWLRNDRAGGSFIRDWARGFADSDWHELLRRAAGNGVFALGLIVDMIDDLFGRRDGIPTLQRAFRESQDALARCLHSAQPTEWRSANDLLHVVARADSAVARDVLGSWPPEEAARLIAETPPAYFDSLSWFLSSARKVLPGWSDEVGRRLDWTALATSLSTVELGDVRSIREAANVLKMLRVPLTRGMLRALVDAMASVLKTATLSAIDYGLSQPLDYYLRAFPDEAQRIYMQMDFSQIGAELTESSPRTWVTLVRLAQDARMHDLPFAERLLEEVDQSRLIPHVEAVGADYPHELRTLLWFLSFGDRSRAAELARALRSVVRTAAIGSPVERGNLLTAYRALDPGLAAELARELGVPEPRPEEDANDEDLAEVDRPRQRCIERFRELDQGGADYDIDAELAELGVDDVCVLIL